MSTPILQISADDLKIDTSITCYYVTKAGILEISMIKAGIYAAQFIEEAIHAPARFINEGDITNLLLAGTPFQIKVWQALLKIPFGATISYEELAITIGHPHSSRAVANAVAINPIAYFIPCHRVIRKNGDLGGYKWNIERKKTLLKAEKHLTL